MSHDILHIICSSIHMSPKTHPRRSTTQLLPKTHRHKVRHGLGAMALLGSQAARSQGSRGHQRRCAMASGQWRCWGHGQRGPKVPGGTREEMEQ